MIIYNDLSHIEDTAKDCVLVIGNFDGVHRGHQALLDRAHEIAKLNGLEVGVLTFEPHPRRLFQPDQPPARLTSPDMKAERLKNHNVDFLFSLPFDWEFASQSAEDFIQNILIDAINTSHVIIGYNFRFGQLRKGNADTIRDAGINVETINAIEDDKGETISSSRIRSLLRAGKNDQANELLGWDWTVDGKIFRGDRRGHELGYPTANILLNDSIHPAYGVYACLVQIEGDDTWHTAATNIGIRPMFEVPEGQIEAHILDFPDTDIYDKILRVRPIKRLRGEAKFDSLDDLIAQMAKDCDQTREVIKQL